MLYIAFLRVLYEENMKYTLHIIQAEMDLIEQLGTKEKFWFTYQNKGSWLLKYSRENTGEHWSEKCAAELSRLLHIPHATYELAKANDLFAVITPNMIPEGSRMVMGNEVLHAAATDYPEPPSSPDEKAVRVKEHTVTRILGCLDQGEISPPLDSPYDIQDLNAADVFCGYLMLDALISNQDRHHENWAIILHNDTGKKSLCPTYDHAACLGRELLDEDRKMRLETKDRNQQIPAFVGRARSEVFKLKTDKKPLTTVDAFIHAVKDRPRAKSHWKSKLQALSIQEIKNVFNSVPDCCMSNLAKEFAIKMVLENQRRLLENE